RALFEGGVAFAQKIGFGHTDLLQCGANRRPGPFANADWGLQPRLDERDGHAIRATLWITRCQHARGDPTGSASADDDDSAGWLLLSLVRHYAPAGRRAAVTPLNS